MVTNRSFGGNVFFLLPLFASVALYFQVVDHEFISFDDGDYTYDNPVVTGGLSWHGFIWSVSDARFANYHPITWWSHMIDYEWIGNRPGLMAFQNALWHGVNSLLVSCLMGWIFRSKRLGLLLGLLFAFHPVLVEGVAWVSQRKTVVATCFFLLSVRVFCLRRILFRKKYRRLGYWISYILFVCSLLAKGVYITYPVLLCFLCFVRKGYNLFDEMDRRRAYLWLKKESFYFVFTGVSCVVFGIVMIWAQTKGQAVSGVSDLPIYFRFQTAINGYWIYVCKFVFPLNLTFFYPYNNDFSFGLTALLCLCLVAFAWFAVKCNCITNGRFLIGWMFFIVGLFPVIGLVQIGAQAHADRYMYGPIIGLIIMSGSLVSFLAKVSTTRWFFYSVRLAGYLWIIGLGVVCFYQIGYWKNDLALSASVSGSIEQNPKAIGLRGLALVRLGEYERAKYFCEWALALAPGDLGNVSCLALCEYALGNVSGAIALQEVYVSERPDSIGNLVNLARYYLEAGLCEKSKIILDECRLLSASSNGSFSREIDVVYRIYLDTCCSRY